MDKSLMLEQLRAAKKIQTKTLFAEILGISTQNLNNWYKRNVYDASVLMRAFPDLNPQWLLTGEGEMLANNEVTFEDGNAGAAGVSGDLVVQTAAAQDVESVVAEEVPYLERPVIESRNSNIREYVESDDVKTIIPQGLICTGIDFARKIYSDAMAPDIREGDIILCNFVPDTSNLVDGDIYVVETTTYGCVMRDIKHDGDEIILMARNGRSPDLRVKQSEIKSVAVPIQLIRSTFSQRTDFSKIIREKDERIGLLVEREFDHIRHTDKLLEQIDKVTTQQGMLIDALVKMK